MTTVRPSKTSGPFSDVPQLQMAVAFPRVRTSEWNQKVVAVFEFNAGSSGPGKIKVRYQGPGDTALGASHATTFNVEPVGYDISFAPSRSGSLILEAIAEGDSEPSSWESTDEGETWTLL